MSLTLRPHVVVTEVDDGLILLDQQNGRYWHLNGTAGRMLRDLLNGHSPEETAARLTGVSPEPAPGDIAPGMTTIDVGCHTEADAAGVGDVDVGFHAQVDADVRMFIDGLCRAKLVNQ